VNLHLLRILLHQASQPADGQLKVSENEVKRLARETRIFSRLPIYKQPNISASHFADATLTFNVREEDL